MWQARSGAKPLAKLELGESPTSWTPFEIAVPARSIAHYIHIQRYSLLPHLQQGVWRSVRVTVFFSQHSHTNTCLSGSAHP